MALGDPESPSGRRWATQRRHNAAARRAPSPESPQNDQSGEFSPPPLHAGIQGRKSSAPLQPASPRSPPASSVPRPQGKQAAPLPTPAPRASAGHRSRRPALAPASLTEPERRRQHRPATAPAVWGCNQCSASAALPSSSSRSRRGPGARSSPQLARLLAEGSGLVVAGIDEQRRAAAPSLAAPATACQQCAGACAPRWPQQSAHWPAPHTLKDAIGRHRLSVIPSLQAGPRHLRPTQGSFCQRRRSLAVRGDRRRARCLPACLRGRPPDFSGLRASSASLSVQPPDLFIVFASVSVLLGFSEPHLEKKKQFVYTILKKKGMRWGET